MSTQPDSDMRHTTWIWSFHAPDQHGPMDTAVDVSPQGTSAAAAAIRISLSVSQDENKPDCADADAMVEVMEIV